MAEVRVENLDRLLRQFGNMGKAARGGNLELALRAGMNEIVNEAKTRAPRRSGQLIRSLHVETSSSGTAAEARGGTNLVYAAVQEFGGTIRAKNAPYLVFEIDGRVYMKTQVTIPAQPYLRPAWDGKIGAARRKVADALARLVKSSAT